MATGIPWHVPLWRWLWLRKPHWFRVVCWLKGHEWMELINDGRSLNNWLCTRCIKAQPDKPCDLRIQEKPK